jgi:hypothetical protein
MDLAAAVLVGSAVAIARLRRSRRHADQGDKRQRQREAASVPAGRAASGRYIRHDCLS